MVTKDETKQPTLALTINPDTTPILYTDNIVMSTNDSGLIMDVCQSLGSANQMKVVARVGMSREHAKKFSIELGRLLAMTEGQIQTGEKT